MTIAQYGGNYPTDEYYYRSSEEVQAPTENTSQNNGDLDLQAIDNGDFSTLVGTWKNGQAEQLTINLDGTVTGSTVAGSSNDLKIATTGTPTANTDYPTVLLINGGKPGAYVALYKIGFKNPYGDHSDSSKARFVINPYGGDYDANRYYYRQ